MNTLVELEFFGVFMLINKVILWGIRHFMLILEQSLRHCLDIRDF